LEKKVYKFFMVATRSFRSKERQALSNDGAEEIGRELRTRIELFMSALTRAAATHQEKKCRLR
jgi:hypothetical protein